MDEPKEALSYARLVNRQKYYMEKALKLEKDFIFGKERLAHLEQQLANTTLVDKEQKTLYKKSQEELKALNEAYDQLKQKYDQEKKENQGQSEEMETKIKTLSKNQRTDHDVDNDTYQQRIKGFERLLSEVQQEINDRETEIAVYKRRLSSLEKRLKTSGEPQLQSKPDLGKVNKIQKPSLKAISYSDYALILDEKRYLIRGDFIIENVGEEPLNSPMLCFRFNPGDTAELKGRIYNINDALSNQAEQQQVKWVFLDNDWAEEAKERGEIWVHPLSKVMIDPGESLTMNDFQIPIESKYVNHLSIEMFVYFQDIDYRIKSANQIIINV